MSYSTKPMFLGLIFAFLLGSFACAQDIDPRGIYFNRFVGQFNGTEWFQVTPVAGSTTQFNIRDIFGGGFLGTITSDGTVLIPGASMDGSFGDADNFVIFPFNGAFTFTSNRVPTTTVDFPLTLDSPRAANPLLNGDWSNTLRQINPETGQVNGSGTETITISTNGNTIRITDPGGLFFQGVFEDGLTAGFRSLSNPNFQPPTGIFASFPGSSTNIGQDLLGELNILNINQFRASFLLQSRTALGNQTQVLFEFEASRINPLVSGDVNGDGAVDGTDEFIVDLQQGLTFEDDGYNLAADVNADGVIDFQDLSLFCVQGDVNSDGQIDFFDIAPFILFLTNGVYFCEADINIDGAVNFFDIAPFIELLSGGN